MAALTLAWDYPTGHAAATDLDDRERAEWPPHPARVFMALSAAWFETEPTDDPGEGRALWLAEKAALEWLESQEVGPEVLVPMVDRGAERSSVTAYVPINDRAGPAAATIPSCPSLTRGRQPRFFPRIWVGDGLCALHWSTTEGGKRHREALDRLGRKVTRIGHSSSLVRMAVVDEAPEADIRYVEADNLAEARLRRITPGFLARLADAFGAEDRRRAAELDLRIVDLQAEQKAARGAIARERKAEIDRAIEAAKQERSAIAPRPPVRPSAGITSGYRREDRRVDSAGATRGLFDPDMLILTHVDGQPMPVASALAVAQQLRRAAMNESAIQPVPDWMSGHAADRSSLRDSRGHMATVPLPFVGHEHADGHLLGMAFVFPKEVGGAERGRALGPLLVEGPAAEPRNVEIKALGGWRSVWRLREWAERRQALLPETWTAAPDGADTWASVTPVVLDRFTKSDRHDPAGRSAWETEVRRIVAESCTRIGLPEPTAIDIGTTSWHVGSPRAVVKRRPLRPRIASHPDAALGDGFPPYPAKGSNASRPQVHVCIRFGRPVVGPVILGAGRFLGYGLCKPWSED